jgi:putative PIN family toxin of toxin-antitoxin system
MRVVLDTSVIVAGLRSKRGASWAILEWLKRREFQIASSPALFLEYEEVLNRPEHKLPWNLVDGLLTELAAVIHPVEVRFRWRPQLTDADDEMVLESAINGQAEAIVTHNRRDFETAARRFGIAVWDPAELLQVPRKKKVD